MTLLQWAPTLLVVIWCMAGVMEKPKKKRVRRPTPAAITTDGPGMTYRHVRYALEEAGFVVDRAETAAPDRVVGKNANGVACAAVRMDLGLWQISALRGTSGVSIETRCMRRVVEVLHGEFGPQPTKVA